LIELLIYSLFSQWCAEIWWWPGQLLDCMPPTKL